MKKIIVFGSLNMDTSIQVNSMPKNGETIDGYSLLLTPGGKGANQIVAAAKSGANTVMIGSVGDDIYGNQLIDSLKSNSVNCQFINKLTNTATGMAMIIRKDGDNRIIVSSGANTLLESNNVANALDEIADPGDIYLTQFETGHINVLDSLSEAKKRNLFTVFNPAPAKEIDDTYYHSIDLLIVNQSESEFLTGIFPKKESECKDVIEYFINKGVSSVIVTLGSSGSVFGEGTQQIYVPSYPVNAVDTTAAGDTYIGTLLYSLSQENNISESMDYASRASALTVTRLGALQSIPNRNEINQFTEGKK